MLLNADARPHIPRGNRAVKALSIPLLLGLVFLIRMPLGWTDQAIFSALIVACCVVIGRLSDSRFTTSTLAMISVFCTLRYILWRWTSSITYLNNSGWSVDRISLLFALMLLCAETYAVIILLLGYFQSARPLKRRPAPLLADTNLWPSVDVFIPTYNEPLEVVRPTVLAAMGIDWPQDRLHIYILDDGRRAQFQEFAAECGAGYLTRFDNAHAKAGNINSALKNTHSEYIAIFDCDHIATRSFLQMTMGWFGKDSRLAMVQTPHHFYSPDPFERNLNVFRKIPNEGALFYGVVQDGNDLWNSTFFCGSCAVIKREALEQIGGIAVETVTEDAHTALRLQRLGWNTAYLGIPQAAGLATGSLAAHVGQRIRWARGMVQILRTECPLFASGLKLPQRLCYFNCVVHYLYAIPRLIFVSSPLVYLLFGKSNVYGFMWEIVAYAAPHLILSNMVNSRGQGDHRHSFWNEVYEMVLTPYILLPTTFALLNPKWGKFNVTAKSSVVEESFFDWKIARPYLFLLALNLIAVIVAIPRYFTAGDPSGVLAINVVWALFNSLMLGVCVAVSFESRQRRSTVRVEADLTATLTLSPDDLHHCRVIDLSEGGLALRSDRILNSAAGQPAVAAIRAGSEEFRFDVETVRTSENRIHMRFRDNDLKHQRAITKIVYARADSWLDWTKDQRRDRILSSLISVFGIGATGIWMLPSLLIKRERKAAAPPAKSALAKTALPGVLVLMLLAPLFQTRAQGIVSPEPAGNAPVAFQKPEESFRDSQSFSDLGRKTALVLRGDKAKSAFSFAVPGTKIVDAAEIALHYQAGDFNAASTYELAVVLNDVEVSTIAVPGTSASEVAHISLPPDLLVHDNALAFELRSQCPAPCKHRSDSEAWVRIESASELETSGVVLRLPNRLSMLPSPFFDPSVRHSIDLPFVFESQPDLSSLKAAGILSSWYGAMAAYRGSHFTVSVGQFPKGNVILLANSNGPLAAELGLAGADALVAMCDNPADHYGKVLAIVANTSANLVSLARLIAQNRLREDGDRISVSLERLADQPLAATAPSWADTSQPLRITSDLNDNLLHTKIGSPTKLYFRIAPDLDYGTKLNVPLHLAFRLSGLSPEDHVWISIRLNNVFVTQRRLSWKDCLEPQNQSYAIPVSLLYPSNTLSIELTTNRSDTIVSDPGTVDLQIMPATSLDLQNPAHFVRMPRLDLFAASGYPFTSKVDLSETTVVLPSIPTAAQIGLFLDALGFMSAQTGVAAADFHLANAKDLGPGNDRNVLVIASSNDESTFRRFERSMAVIPSDGKFQLGESSLPWQEWFSRAWLGRKEEQEKLNSLLEAEGGPRFLLEEFVSPFRSDRSVLVLAPRSETDDQPYFDRLAEASREGAIRGGLAIANDGRFTPFQLNSGSYSLGGNASLAAIYGWLRFHLWILPLLLIGAALVLAHWWESLLARQLERRLQGAV
ncbi:MAG: UDP-forming cellulose synthase catalytic subunit [Acidobacteriota bacterium]|nr:UDP-forming cellulose synthase catalytic subunit [Acidobacteriota bacterium]